MRISNAAVKWSVNHLMDYLQHSKDANARLAARAKILELVDALVDAQDLLEENCPAAEWNQKEAAKIAKLLRKLVK